MTTYTITEAQRLEAMDALYLPSMKTEAMLRQKDKAYVMLQSLTPNSGEAIGEVELISTGVGDEQRVNFRMYESIPALGTKLFTHPAPSAKPADTTTKTLTEHSGCGSGTQVDQLTVRLNPGDKVVLVMGAYTAAQEGAK